MSSSRKSLLINQVKERKIFLNCMNSWFSNFIIEEFRTDYIPDAKIKNTFMGTIDINGHPLPRLFEPIETTVEEGYNYNQKVFDNDIIIYNLDDSNLSEVEFVIRGLKNLKYEKEKILIIISNVMTWAKTPLKTFTDEEKADPNFKEEEVPEIKEEIIKKKEEQKPEPLPVEEEKPPEEEKQEKEKEKEKEKPAKGKSAKGKKGKKTKGKEKEKEKEDKKSKDKNKKKEKEKEKDKTLKRNTKSKDKLVTEKLEKKLEDETHLNIEKIQNEKIEQKPEEEEEKKEEPQVPKIKTYYYKENEYRKRIPNSRYIPYKMLENLALSNTNPMLNVYVICPGFIYGCGEDFFFDYFRKAWIGGIDYIPIIGDGMNFIPTIHILDLIQIIRRIIERKPIINYIFACDKTKNPTMKNIIKSISKGIGSIDIKTLTDFEIDEIDMPYFNELSIDVQIKSSMVTDDEPRKPNESIEEYEKRKFKWHCEKGIPENMDLISQEFNLYRGIKPIKIIITGPPSGGKSFISEKIAKQFKITHLTMVNICEWAKDLKNLLGEETRQKMKENEEKVLVAQEEYEHRKNKKKSDPPFNPSPYRKFSSEFVGKLLKEKLGTGECAGKGYVLDNYPKTYQDCLNVFAKAHKKIIKRVITEEEREKEKKAKKKEDKNKNKDTEEEKEEEVEIVEYEVIKSLLPDSVIMINNYTEESLRNKLMLNPEYEEKQQELDIRFNRRLEEFKENNETPSDPNTKTLETFYKENNIEIHYVNETEFMNNQEIENIKIIEYLERYGNIDNFSKLQDEEEILPFKEQENADADEEEKILMDDGSFDNNNLLKGLINPNKKEEGDNKNDNNKVNETKEEINLMKIEAKIKERIIDEDFMDKDSGDKMDKSEKEKEILIKESKKKKSTNGHSLNEMLIKQEQNEKNIRNKLGELKEKEKKLLEKKSEVLRRYLNEKIMPLLAKGILNICDNMPEDPVEALANYLLDNSFNMPKQETNKSNKSNKSKSISDEDDD